MKGRIIMYFDSLGCYILRASFKDKSGQVRQAKNYGKKAFKIYISGKAKGTIV